VLRNKTNLGIATTMKRLYGRARRVDLLRACRRAGPAAALETICRARDELYSAGLRLIFRLPVRDVDSVKLYRGSAQRSLRIRSQSNFFEAEMPIALCRRGDVVREVDIEHRPRIAGRAKGVTPRAAAHALGDLCLFALRDLIRGRLARR